MGKTGDIGVSVALGLCFGVVIGMLLGNVTMGLAMGPLFGLVLHGFQRDEPRDADGSDDV
jgi:mannose/fructose/N-acetylgalactosamine-specific phosphotransferase system component IIC